LTSEQKRSWNDLNEPPYNAFRNSSKLAKPQSGTLNWLVEEVDNSAPTDQSENVPEQTLSNKEFVGWRDSNTSASLLVVAPPGRGKSVLSNFVLQHLESQVDNHPLVTTKTIYYFCNIKEAETSRNARSLLRALVVQLCERQQRLFDMLPTEYKTKSKSFLNASFDTLWHIFERMLQDEAYGRINCIIDGLDVYHDGMDELIDKLSVEILRPQAVKSSILKFFYTSRPGAHLSKWPFKHQVFLRCNPQDLDCFIISRTLNLGQSFTEEMREVIKRECNAQADRTFLWLEVVFRKIKLLTFPNTQKIKDAIQKSSHDLFKLYEGLISEIRGDTDAVRLLAWVAYAMWPMNLASLEDALAVHLEDQCTSLQSRKLKRIHLTVEEVFKACGTILDVIEDKVYFIHQSVKDYFDQEDPLKPLLTISPRLVPAYVCLVYLTSEDLGQKIDKLGEFPLAFYASRFWYDHIESTADIMDSKDLQTLLIKLIAPSQLGLLSYRLQARGDEFELMSTSAVALHYDIGWLAKLLLDNSVAELPNDFPRDYFSDVARYPNSRKVLRVWLAHESCMCFPLESRDVEAIARSQDHTMFELLLKTRGQDIRITSDVMAAAADNSSHAKKVTETILQNGGDSTLITSDVLEIAARNWSSGEKLVELLLDQTGDEALITSGVLKAAAGNDEIGENILKMLFAKMSDDTKVTEDVVNEAASNWFGGEQIMKLLIDRGVRVGADVLANAARNYILSMEILRLLYSERKDEVHVTVDALAAAAGQTNHGGEALKQLLSDPERYAAGLRITDDLVRTAAGNWHQGLELMRSLLDWRPEEVHITMEVQMAIIKNEKQGFAIMMLLLERRADDTHVTGDIAWQILEYCGANVMRLILERRGDSYFMSQHVIQLLANHLVHLAILNDKPDDLEALLALGADANFDIDGCTPLTWAARQGDLPVTKLLLANKAEPSRVTTTEWSPLDIAASWGHVEIIRVLLEGGTITDKDRLSALVEASIQDDVEVIKLLLDSGVDISGSVNNGWTPLGAASRNGHLETVQLLLTRGANPLVGNEHGWSPLDTAAANGHVEIVKILLIHESFKTVHDKRSLCGTIANTLAYYGHIDLLEYIVQHNHADLQTPDRLKRTPLLFAARGRHVQTFEYLVDYGLPLNTLDAKGDGLMSYAASSGYPQLLEAILEHEFEFSTQPGHWSPLHWACRSGNVEVVERIVEAMIAKDRQKGPITIVDTEGEWTRKWTPRAIAIFHGNEDRLWDLSEASQAAIGARDTIVHAMSYRNHAMCTFCFHVSKRPVSL
jgi:ankyrin repeat protein